MSYDLIVYLKRADMPAPIVWKDAITAAQFPVELDADFDVDTFAGFLPCPVNGVVSGFEYYSSIISEEDAIDLELVPEVNFFVQFSIGSAPLELVSALAASSVLASLAGGWLCDPQDDAMVKPADAVIWAKSQLAQNSAL